MVQLLAAAAPTSDALGDWLKIVQIGFYIIGALVAIITCTVAVGTLRAAKKSWLTPTNTEYQKRVIERLAKLSEDLYSEFNPASDSHWSNTSPVHAGIREITNNFDDHREEVLAAKQWPYGTPHTKDVQRLENLLHPVLSDPFIPENIREAVIDLLENRIAVMSELYTTEFEKYAEGLAKGKREPLVWPVDMDAINTIHNRVNEAKNERGCGISAIGNAVHDIRGLIQDYFDSFNPHGVGKGTRRKFEIPPEEPS